MSKDRIVVKQYKKARDFSKDAEKMSRAGYEVVGQVSSAATSGVGRKAASLAMPVLMFLPHKDHIVVTYQLRSEPA